MKISMIRIYPNINIISPKFSHYNVKLYYRNQSYDLTKYYYNLNIHSHSLDINHIETPKPIRENLINYLNYEEKKQHNCFHFARSIVNSSKYNVKSLPTSQLDYLQLFDKIGLIHATLIISAKAEGGYASRRPGYSALTSRYTTATPSITMNREVIINHEAIYIGKHYNQHLFMSKLAQYGIYFMTLEQLQKVYDSFRFSLMVYRATSLLNYNNERYDDNIRRDHRYDKNKLDFMNK